MNKPAVHEVHHRLEYRSRVSLMHFTSLIAHFIPDPGNQHAACSMHQVTDYVTDNVD